MDLGMIWTAYNLSNFKNQERPQSICDKSIQWDSMQYTAL